MCSDRFIEQDIIYFQQIYNYECFLYILWDQWNIHKFRLLVVFLFVVYSLSEGER